MIPEKIGIAYLSAMAKQDNHKTYFYSLDMLLFINYVKEIKPDVIAYSCNSLNFNNMISENKRLKKHFSFISIMGGPHPTFYPDNFKNLAIDAQEKTIEYHNQPSDMDLKYASKHNDIVRGILIVDNKAVYAHCFHDQFGVSLPDLFLNGINHREIVLEVTSDVN